MIIYNKNTKTPYYYNGQQWVSLGGRFPNGANAPVTDRITYQICAPGWSCAEETLLAMSHGVSNPATLGLGGITPGNASFSSFNLTKEMDINSMNFNQLTILGIELPSIEIKFYAQGQASPYLSYRFRDIVLESYQTSGSLGGQLIESVSILFEIYGFKDWENNKEFGYNLVTKTITTY